MRQGITCFAKLPLDFSTYSVYEREAQDTWNFPRILGLPLVALTGNLDLSRWNAQSLPLLRVPARASTLLGEPLRLKLLAVLASGERSAGELATLVGASQPNVSKHLTALTQGGMISRRKAGTNIYYIIADESVLALCDVVCASVRRKFAAQARELGMDTYHRSQEPPS